MYFLMSPKGPPFIFLMFCNRMDVYKAKREPFHIFRNYYPYKNLIFCSFDFFFNFSIFGNRLDVKKSQRVPLLAHQLGPRLRIFGTMKGIFNALKSFCSFRALSGALTYAVPSLFDIEFCFR